MKRILIFTIGLVFLCTTAGFAMHKGGGMKGGHMHHGNKWWQKPAIAEMIDLSAEEKSKIADMWVNHHRMMLRLKGNLHVEKFELEVLDDKKDFDATAFRQQFEKVQKIRAELDTERINYRLEVRSFLGSDRFLKISSHLPMYKKGKMKGGKGMMGMHGGKKGMKGMHHGKGMKGMMGKHGCKGMMGMGDRGMKNCCMMMGSPQGKSEAESSSTQGSSQ